MKIACLLQDSAAYVGDRVVISNWLHFYMNSFLIEGTLYRIDPPRPNPE